jgi:hypothetical protein
MRGCIDQHPIHRLAVFDLTRPLTAVNRELPILAIHHTAILTIELAFVALLA